MTSPQEPQPPPEPCQPESERYPFWGYRDLFLLGGLAFVLLVVVNTAALLVYRSERVTASEALAVTFVFESLWFILLYAVIRTGYGRPFWSSLGWVRPPAGFWPCLGWGLLTAVVTIALGSLMPRPRGTSPLEELLSDRASILLLGSFAVTLGPLFEELVFRGFLMPLLVRSFGAVGGVLLQAAPFALLHGMEYKWAWQQLVLMFLAGSAFGWMRHKTGSTAASTYMHAGYNLVSVVGLLAQSFSR
jgi:membrane protease YdiL (CAAX protease family)